MNLNTLDRDIIDELKDLSSGPQDSFFFDQVLLFSKRGHESLETLDRALAEKDRPALAAAAHRLAGASAVIGACQLSALCLDLEDRQSGWSEERLMRTVHAIRKAFEEAESELAREASDVFINVERPPTAMA